MIKAIYYQGDGAGWVLDEEAKSIRSLGDDLGVRFTSSKWNVTCPIYYGSKYRAISRSRFELRLRHSTAFDYFHGDPSISEAFHPLYKQLIKKKDLFTNIRVSHSGIEKLLLDDGFGDSVVKIPIGIDTNSFLLSDVHEGSALRREYGVPLDATVVGSFQKDGNGWGKGLDPKLIKGPDIFLKTMFLLQRRVRNLFVILSGPARGYIKRGLSELRIPFRHFNLERYAEIPRLYKMIDVYLVASREEGGPKAILESMATGVPIVSTPVGQAVDLIRSGKNGYMATGFSPEELSELLLCAIDNPCSGDVREAGRMTAEEHSYENLIPLWKKFFKRMIDQ